MVDVKASEEEKTIEIEIDRFQRFVAQFPDVKEVNFDRKQVTYRKGNYMISITYKALKK